MRIAGLRIRLHIYASVLKQRNKTKKKPRIQTEGHLSGYGAVENEGLNPHYSIISALPYKVSYPL